MKHVLAALIVLAGGATAQATEPLPSEDLGEMAAGRLRLESLLSEGARQAAPAAMARAEDSFACWITGPEYDDSGSMRCHDEFLAAIGRVEQSLAMPRRSLVAAH